MSVAGAGGVPAGSGGSAGTMGSAGFPGTAGVGGKGGSGGTGTGGGAGAKSGNGGSSSGAAGTSGKGGTGGAGAAGKGGAGGSSGAGTGGAGTGGAGSGGAPTGVIDLATGQKTPLGIGLDSLHVYWVNVAPPSIWRVLKTGGAPEPLVGAIDLGDPRDVMVDGTTLYWSDWTGNVIRKRDLSGGTPQDFCTGAGRVNAIAMNSGIAYATDDRTDMLGQGTVIVVPPGMGAQVLFSLEPLSTGLGVAGNDLAWGRNGSIALGTTSGGPSVTLVGQPDTVKVSGVALDDQNVYWIEDEQRIKLANRITGKPMIFYDPAGGLGRGDVAVDAQYVYWTEPDTGHIRKQLK